MADLTGQVDGVSHLHRLGVAVLLLPGHPQACLLLHGRGHCGLLLPRSWARAPPTIRAGKGRSEHASLGPPRLDRHVARRGLADVLSRMRQSLEPQGLVRSGSIRLNASAEPACLASRSSRSSTSSRPPAAGASALPSGPMPAWRGVGQGLRPEVVPASSKARSAPFPETSATASDPGRYRY
jgi:hypothetical protein